MLDGVPQPPVHMVVNATGQTVATAVFVSLALLALGAAAIYSWRSRSLFAVLMVVGGAMASLNEPMLDELARVWFPDRGDWRILQFFGHSLPLWVPFACSLFFGGCAFIMAVYFRRGASKKVFWIGTGLIVLFNFLLELPLLHANMYVYYGYQPFSFFGLPLVWPFINPLGAVLAGVALAKGWNYFRGRRQLLILGVPLVGQLGGAIVGAPAYYVGNTSLTGVAPWIACVITMVAAVYAASLLVNAVAPTHSAPAAPREARGATSREPVTTGS